MSSPTSADGTATAVRRILHPGSAGMLLGGVLLILGSLMPWVSTPLGNLSGMAGPGLWVLCAGTIALAGALLPYRRIALAHALLPGVLAAALVGWQAIRMIQLSAANDSWGKLLPGMGLILVGGGAAVLLRAALRIRSST